MKKPPAPRMKPPPVPATAKALPSPITPPAATPSIGPSEPIAPVMLARTGEIAGNADVKAPASEWPMTVETELVIFARRFIEFSKRSVRASMKIHTLFGKDLVSVCAVATARVKSEVSPLMLVVTLLGNDASSVRADTALCTSSESASKSTRVL